jgi:prepilin-type N-terminal cleavage/methylation domain-containing protein
VRSGFTLVEVLLAMLITSFLVLGIHGAYRQAHVLWSTVEDKRSLYEASCRAIECLRTDLAGAYLPVIDPEGKAFVLAAESDGSRELTFYSLSPGWRASLEAARSAKIRYRFTKNETAHGNILERFEQLCASEQPIAQEVRDVLLAGPFELRLWALEAGASLSDASWKEYYESPKQAPRAIKLLIQWQAEDGIATDSFDALVPVLCESQIQEDESEGSDDPTAVEVIPRQWWPTTFRDVYPKGSVGASLT